MSEIPRWVSAATGIGLGVTVLAGCADTSPDAPTIPRCYNAPLNHQSPTEILKSSTKGQPVLKVPVTAGLAKGDPIAPSDTEIDSVTDALVEVTTAEGKGTGFVVEDRGRQVVITAAHVVGTAAMSQLTITTQDGRHFRPNGGCYIYEDGEKQAPLTSDEDEDEDTPIQSFDVAVLTLSSQVTSHTLSLTTRRPHAGSWVDLINYQATYGPEDSQFEDEELYHHPAAYTGVVTPANEYDSAIRIITGARDYGHAPTNGEFNSNHLVSGASGGPVLQGGKVIGVSVNSTKDGLYEGPEELKSLYNIAFPGSDTSEDTHFVPTVGGVVPAYVVRKALQSPALKLK